MTDVPETSARMESIHGADFWTVCHGPKVVLCFPPNSLRNLLLQSTMSRFRSDCVPQPVRNVFCNVVVLFITFSGYQEQTSAADRNTCSL